MTRPLLRSLRRRSHGQGGFWGACRPAHPDDRDDEGNDMHESMSMTSEADWNPERRGGHVESALEGLTTAQEQAEKAVAVLIDRLESVLQPSQPISVPVDDSQKNSLPESPVVRRINGTADELRRLVRRVESVIDRLDT